MRTKTWDTRVVLSAASDRFVCENFVDVQTFVEWWCGFPVWTHQLPRIARENKSAWKALFPAQCNLDYKGADYRQWVDDIVSLAGPTMDITAPPSIEMIPIDPIEEAEKMVGLDRVIVLGCERETK